MEKPKEALKTIPQSPGVYIFRNNRENIIYIGKAVNLLRRVSSYFAPKNQLSPKTQLLQDEIETIDTIPTTSEFDAILLEARLIRKYIPHFNIIAKDDKSPLYVKITLSEPLPRVLFLRKSQLTQTRRRDLVIGPFQSATIARRLLSELRHGFPFCLQKRRDGRPCFYTHLGLCSPCPSFIAGLPDGTEKQSLSKKYRKNLFELSRVLTGKSNEVLAGLNSSMRTAASKNQFEQAGTLKKQAESLITLLARHHDPRIYEDRVAGITFSEELENLKASLVRFYPEIRLPSRIECIDISNLFGRQPTGSLVVLLDGYPAPSEYRRFGIRSKKTPDDFMMVQEVLSRRLKHMEWPYPDLLVIDGGKPQVHAAQTILSQLKLDIPLIGLAKRFEEVVIPSQGKYSVLKLPLSSGALHVLQRVRDEAHRFAKSYHIYLRRAQSLPKTYV